MIKQSIFLAIALTSCTADVVDEPAAKVEQALCTLPTSTTFHKLVLSQISVTEECAAANPDEFLALYSTSEPKRWRIDAAAPAPKKPNGQSCSWLSTPMLIPSTPACDLVRSFTCSYGAGPLIYHAFITAASGASAPKNPWDAATYVMYVQDPSGAVWGGCTRTLQGPFPIE